MSQFFCVLIEKTYELWCNINIFRRYIMLDNKLGIKSEIELANEEERITKINMSQDNFKNIIKNILK